MTIIFKYYRVRLRGCRQSWMAWKREYYMIYMVVITIFCIPWYRSNALASACSLQSVFCSCGHLMHTHMHPQDIININHIGIIDWPKVKCDKIKFKAGRTELSMLSMKQEKGHQGDHSSWSNVDNTKYKHGRAFTDMTSAHIYEESLHYWCFFCSLWLLNWGQEAQCCITATNTAYFASWLQFRHVCIQFIFQ